MWTEQIFSRKRPAIAMVHLDALPGTVLYNEASGLGHIIENAAHDYAALSENGIDGVIFCNENDKPYTKSAGPELIASMTAVVLEVMRRAERVIPFGIDVQWDPIAAIAVAKATGAGFIRGILCGTFCGDLGLLTPDPLEIAAYRKRIGADDVKLLTNLSPEFSYSIDQRDVTLRAQTVIKSSLIDGLCVSGAMAGGEAPLRQLREIKAAVANTRIPVFANTGVNHENVSEILSIADGCITATCLKKGKLAANRIDPQNVRDFVANI